MTTDHQTSYAPLSQAGLSLGMNVADFGCGAGATTRMLAEMVGPFGSVTGIDADAGQIRRAIALCEDSGLTNTSFIAASVYSTGLPRNSFSAVYCRFLLLHWSDPAACLREMHDVLAPGGILLLDDFVDYSNKLFHMVKDAGFRDTQKTTDDPGVVVLAPRMSAVWARKAL